jgi:hypothetical protein
MNIYSTLINQFANKEGWKLNETEDGIFIETADENIFKGNLSAIEHVVDNAIENPKGFHADALLLLQWQCPAVLFLVKKAVGRDKWVKLFAAVMAFPEFA